MQEFFVYMLKCSDDTFYTGWTTNLQRRIDEHNRGTASKYTRARLPVTPVYHENVASKSEALKREWAIKQMSRVQKQALQN